VKNDTAEAESFAHIEPTLLMSLELEMDALLPLVEACELKKTKQTQ